jgi:hypothetical protein
MKYFICKFSLFRATCLFQISHQNAANDRSHYIRFVFFWRLNLIKFGKLNKSERDETNETKRAVGAS